jgi:pimeloyl-ACP methyl ester carboxylesterase
MGTTSMGLGGSGAAGTMSAAAGSGGAMMGKGACCPSGDCLCHGPAPTALTVTAGPYKTQSMPMMTGTVYYPTDAEPPFAAVALCGGFLNTGPEMEAWAPLYASYGIVTIIVTTGAADLPDLRATELLAAIKELDGMGKGSSGPLAGKLSGRYGTSGYSMGGGGTTIAAGTDATLKTSVGLAPWGGSGSNVMVPTLLLCGETDTVAPCDMAQSVYTGMPAGTKKMIISIPGTTHFNWFGPTDAGGGTSGKYALAFQKVFLEGDERWKPMLLMKPSGGTQMTNIQ